MGNEASKKGSSAKPQDKKKVDQGNGSNEVNAKTTPTKEGTGIEPGMFVTKKKGVFSERYQGLKMLGKGSFGEVILCRDRTSKQECAVKVINKRSLKRSADHSSLLAEVQLLKQLDHPNIMKLYEFFEDPGYYYLVGEVYTGGELFDEITSRKRFSEADAAMVIKQVLSGIVYMHKLNVVHRDLKPENLLLESKKKDAIIKIIDFGLSTYFAPDKDKRMKEKIGTAYYIAPEVLKGVYDSKCDIWSCGVILYILLSGCPPFYGNTEQEIIKRVEAAKYSFTLPQWKKVSESAKDLIRRMLTYEPEKRPTAAQCLEHEWIKKITKTKNPDLPELEGTMNNIKQFQSTNNLAKAAMLFIGSKLTTSDEISDLRKVFYKLDKNNDGQLDRDELKEAYSLLIEMQGGKSADGAILEAHDDIIEQTLKAMDFSNNGTIDFSEFITVAMDKNIMFTHNKLKAAFDHFDTNGNGRIDLNELKALGTLLNMEDSKVEEMMKEVDTNGDLEIDFDEFKTLLNSMQTTD